jgi:hypothetical protein
MKFFTYNYGGSTMVKIKGNYKQLYNYKILKSSLHKLEIFIRSVLPRNKLFKNYTIWFKILKYFYGILYFSDKNVSSK